TGCNRRRIRTTIGFWTTGRAKTKKRAAWKLIEIASPSGNESRALIAAGGAGSIRAGRDAIADEQAAQPIRRDRLPGLSQCRPRALLQPSQVSDDLPSGNPRWIALAFEQLAEIGERQKAQIGRIVLLALLFQLKACLADALGPIATCGCGDGEHASPVV